MKSAPTLALAAVLSLAACDHPDQAIALSPPATEEPAGLTVDGEYRNPLQHPGKAGTTLIFLRSDCPIANRYVPEIKRIAAAFQPQGIAVYLIYPCDSATEVRKHLEDFELDLPALRDPGFALARAHGASMTPEAIVFDPSGRWRYRGRIDDRYADFGVLRPQPGRRDLHDTLTSLVSGAYVEPRSTRVVGCLIE